MMMVIFDRANVLGAWTSPLPIHKQSRLLDPAQQYGPATLALACVSVTKISAKLPSRSLLTTPDPLDLRITTPAWAEQEEALGVNDLSMLEEEDVRLPQMAFLLPVDTLKRDTDSRTRAFDEDSTSTLDTENTVSIDLIITAEMGSNNIN